MRLQSPAAKLRSPCQSNSVAQFRTFAPARQVHASRLRLRCTGTTRHKRKPASCVARSLRHFTFVPVATSPLRSSSVTVVQSGRQNSSASGRLASLHYASTPLKEARPPLPLHSVPPSPVTARSRLHITHKPLSSLSILGQICSFVPGPARGRLISAPHRPQHTDQRPGGQLVDQTGSKSKPF